MMDATIKGIVQNGVVRLPEGVVLPECQSVYVVVPGPSDIPADARVFKMPGFRLANPEDAKRFELTVEWEHES